MIIKATGFIVFVLVFTFAALFTNIGEKMAMCVGLGDSVTQFKVWVNNCTPGNISNRYHKVEVKDGTCYGTIGSRKYIVENGSHKSCGFQHIEKHPDWGYVATLGSNNYRLNQQGKVIMTPELREEILQIQNERNLNRLPFSHKCAIEM